MAALIPLLLGGLLYFLSCFKRWQLTPYKILAAHHVLDDLPCVTVRILFETVA